MSEVEKPMLDGKIEMDETYVGGKIKGRGIQAKRLTTKHVIGIRQRNGELRLFHAKDVKAGTIAQFIRENISEDVDVIITTILRPIHSPWSGQACPKSTRLSITAQRSMSWGHSYQHRRIGFLAS